MGNTTLPFAIDGVQAQLNGYENVRAVLSWMEDQKFDLDQLVLLSCSAGSLGLQVHAHDILTRFPARRTAVVLDSFVGVFRYHKDSIQFQNFGVCQHTKLLNWDDELVEACYTKQLTAPLHTNRLIKAFPKVQFVGISSKTGTYKFY